MRPAESAGESKRSVSSIASGTSDRSARTASSSPGVVSSACSVLPIRSAVVMIPAPSMMMSRSTISSWERSPDSTSRSTSPPTGARWASPMRFEKYPRSCSVDSTNSGVPLRFGSNIPMMRVSVQTRNSSRRSGSTPRKSLITVIGTRSPKSAAMSMRPERGSALEDRRRSWPRWSASRPFTARGVKSTFTEPRMRVWSGGSM